MRHPKSVFYVYADTDEAFRRQLENHLMSLQRQRVIAGWQQSLAGSSWREEQNQALENAGLILFLVSADFLASNVCYEEQMQRALQRQQRGQVLVVPIWVRPVDLTGAPFLHLPLVPTNMIAVTSWNNQDAAWAHIAEAIRSLLEGRPLPLISPEQSRQPSSFQQTGPVVLLAVTLVTIFVFLLWSLLPLIRNVSPPPSNPTATTSPTPTMTATPTPSPTPAPEQPSDTLSLFCYGVSHGPTDAVYQQLYSSNLKKQVSFGQFNAEWSKLSPDSDTSSCIPTITSPSGNHPTGTVEVIKYPSGEDRIYAVTLIKEGKIWKIDRLQRQS